MIEATQTNVFPRLLDLAYPSIERGEGSLESALQAFDDDAEFRRTIGDGFCDYFRTSRAWELTAWREAVSNWERERYERAV